MKNTIQNIFEMTTNINEPMKEVVDLELLIFKRFQMDAKNINVLLNGGRGMNQCFL
jgi:hypothetical protein